MSADPLGAVPAATAATLRACLALSQERGAIGPDALERHIVHAAAFAAVVEALGPPPDRFVDLGSGGGLPGLVLAALWPAASGVLLDGRTERVRMLAEHVAALGWGERVTARAERAEDAGRGPLRGSFAVTTARGFAPPAVTAECAAPLLSTGGLLVVSEPPADTAPPDRWSEEGLAALGLERCPIPETGYSFAAFRQTHPCPERFPRRVGVPAKRPLF